MVCSARILVATSSGLMPSIESSIVCAIPFSWVWRSVAAFIARLRAGKLRLHILDRLLTGLRREICRDALR